MFVFVIFKQNCTYAVKMINKIKEDSIKILIRVILSIKIKNKLSALLTHN